MKNFNLQIVISNVCKEFNLNQNECFELIVESQKTENVEKVYQEWLEEESGLSFPKYFEEYLSNYYRYDREC